LQREIYASLVYTPQCFLFITYNRWGGPCPFCINCFLMWLLVCRMWTFMIVSYWCFII
jgi:hypothetical protein